MTATLQDISQWVHAGDKEIHSHVIIAVDQFDFENYPVYVYKHESVQDQIRDINLADLTAIDEVYNLSLDIPTQLAKRRNWEV